MLIDNYYAKAVVGFSTDAIYHILSTKYFYPSLNIYQPSSVCVFICLFRYGAGQLKVMFVGGPNIRKDYHLDEGEEVYIYGCFVVVEYYQTSICHTCG